MPAGAWIEIILYCRTPALHKAITEVFIEKGRWQLADSENKRAQERPARTPAETIYEDRRMSLLLSTLKYITPSVIEGIIRR